MKKLCLIISVFISVCSLAQNIKISEMTEATDLTGAYIPIIQGGLNKKAPSTLFGVSSFQSLTDGPGSFSTKGLNFIRVNTGATALEYQTPSQVLSAISGVPTSRQITINGNTQSLATDPSWTVTGTGTAGSIVFVGASGYYSEDNSNFFWDTSNKRIGIGTNSVSAKLHIVQSASSGAVLPIFRSDPGPHTNMTATQEFFSRDFQGATQQWATGSLTTQRFNYFRGYTLAFVGASTATDVYTMYVDQTVAGINATITRNWALGVNGNLQLGTSSGSNAAYMLSTNGQTSGYFFSLSSAPATAIGGIYSQESNSTINVYAASNRGLAFFTNATQRLMLHVNTGDALLGTTNDNARFYVVQPPLSSSWLPIFRSDPGPHTGMTATQEFFSRDFQGATWTWLDGTTTTQRFNYFRGYTLNKTTTSATFNNAYTMYIDQSAAGTGVTIINNFALGLNGNLGLISAPSNDNALTQVLVRDGTTGIVKYRDASSIGGSGISGLTSDYLPIATSSTTIGNSAIKKSTTSSYFTDFSNNGNTQFAVINSTSGSAATAILAVQAGTASAQMISYSQGHSTKANLLEIINNSGNIILTPTSSVSLPHLVGTTSAPSIAAGTGAGTSPSVSVSGTDLAGTITVTTGTAPSGTNAIIATITFNAAYASAPKVILTAANRNANGLIGVNQVLVPANGQTNGVTTTTFVIESNTTGLTASTTYLWSYQVIQ